MTYQYFHPNHKEWIDVQAECDAKSFYIMNDWPVQSYNRDYFKADENNLFGLAVGAGGIFEITSEIYISQTKNPVIDVRFPGTELSYSMQSVGNFQYIKAQIFMTCPSSDPKDMKMPLQTVKGDKLWMLPIPKEVFGFEGAYVRIKVPNANVQNK